MTDLWNSDPENQTIIEINNRKSLLSELSFLSDLEKSLKDLTRDPEVVSRLPFLVKLYSHYL